ncbi:LacI family DNA-binding transcriptional regulator [Flagellimonas olearia]|nr:LacI family DNA-binding transcriptional regulator [Allomuricauda olearia]
MGSPVSLKDIANKVGVSIPLVSYVLTGKGKQNRVSEETAEKILKVAKELNYQPNLSARSLKTNKTKTIGVILADISNPFFSNMARVIEDEAFLRDYTVIFGSSDEKIEKFDKVLEFMLSRQVDGFIIAPPEGSKASISELLKNKNNVVLIDRYFEDLDANFVIVDNVAASLSATNYLIKKGYKRIATIAYKSKLAHFDDRCRGYYKALEQAGMSLDENLVVKIERGSSKKDMGKAIDELIGNDLADAIFFQTNTLAEEGIRQMLGKDRETLKKIGVMVFDQNSAYHFLENHIPYMNQPIKQMGKAALAMLIDNIQSKYNGAIKKLQLKTTLGGIEEE